MSDNLSSDPVAIRRYQVSAVYPNSPQVPQFHELEVIVHAFDARDAGYQADIKFSAHYATFRVLEVTPYEPE